MTALGKLDLSGRVAVVTGGASGMGESSARLMAERGAKVIIADRNEELAVAVAKDIGDAAEPFHMDVTQPDECEAMVAAALEVFGGLDVAVNSAGVVDGEGIPFMDTTVEHWRRILSTNLDGVFYSMKAEIPPMLEAGRGSIINIGSIHSVAGIAGAAAYTSSKHGVLGLTRSAALAYGAQGIRINCIGPGNMDTPMSRRAFAREGGDQALQHVVSLASIPRLGEAWEVAEMVAFLASDAAGFCTGAWFGVDGGYTAH